SSAVAGELPVRRDDPVARHDDGDGIPRVRAGDRPDGGRVPDRASELGVRPRRARRDLPETRPDFLLKRRAFRVDLERIERPEIAVEITPERAAGRPSLRVGRELEGAEALL